MDLERAIIDFCRGKSSFSLKEVEDSLKKELMLKNRSAADYLEDRGFVFVKGQGDSREYVTRESFFKKIKFRVVPTDYEIENGILIPGHRFLPFYGPEILASELSLIDICSKKQIESQKRLERIEDLYRYHYLFGADSIIDNFIAEDVTNREVIGKNPRDKINIWVFDFESVYKRPEFLASGAFELEVESWEKGILNLEVADPSIRDPEEGILFIETLENCLFKVFEKEGPYIEVAEQLAKAYFLSTDIGKKNPPLSIDEFIMMSENVKIKYFEHNTLLWYKKTDNLRWTPPEESSDEDIFYISEGDISSLDAILKELGLSVTSTELKNLLNQSEEKRSMEELFGEVIPFSSIKFRDKAQEVALKNFLEELVEEFQQ